MSEATKKRVASVGMADLLKERGETAGPKAQRYLVQLPHPNQDKILAAVERLEQGDVEDANEVLAEIRDALTNDGITVSFSTTKLVDGRISNEPVLGPDGKPSVAPGVFMLYLQRPDPTQDLQGQVFKSFGPRTGPRKYGWNDHFLACINGVYRADIGEGEPATAGSDGDDEVLPS